MASTGSLLASSVRVRPHAAGVLAGLRTDGRDSVMPAAAYWPSLPRPVRAQCLMTAVVPVHRCGAVPDSHRVPSCDNRPGRAAEPAHNDCDRPSGRDSTIRLAGSTICGSLFAIEVSRHLRLIS